MFGLIAVLIGAGLIVKMLNAAHGRQTKALATVYKNAASYVQNVHQDGEGLMGHDHDGYEA